MEGTTALNIGEAVGGLFEIAGSALDLVTGNPILFTMFCAGLVFTGIAIVNKFRKQVTGQAVAMLSPFVFVKEKSAAFSVQKQHSGSDQRMPHSEREEK